MIYPASTMCDFYKIGHKDQYPEKTEYVYSTFTPRSTRIDGIEEVVVFAIQSFVKKWLINYFNENFFQRPKEDIVDEYKRVIYFTLINPGNIQQLDTIGINLVLQKIDSTHMETLHDLGYLPIKIRALKEGTLAPIRVPILTIENTHPKFYWLTNFIETLMSTEIWQPITNATVAFEYRKILQRYARETGDEGFVQFQGHDFSMRGMAGIEASKSSGAAHLLSFVGTDTIPAILYLEEFYCADIEKELVGTSVPATEHSVMCANGTDEKEVINRLISEIYPSGIISIVSDTWDFWNLVENVYPSLKDNIMARDGKVVIRPDSGDPVKIICGEDIEDISAHCFAVEDIPKYVEDILVDKVRDETPHGEHGEMNPEGIFKFLGKYYKVKVDISWNRYDKQYYFIDGHHVSSFEEVTPTAEQLGLIESLWNSFGGVFNDKGYKQLDPHIGTIYGDSINLERAKAICEGLKKKGFASTNIVFGVGSYTYQYNTRDTFGFALKATHVVIDGVEKQIFKDPKTDDGAKKSQKGRVAVVQQPFGKIICLDQMTNHQEMVTRTLGINLLEDVFVNGELVREQSLAEIRKELLSNI